MNKIFLSLTSMIVTAFLMKSYKKLREKPETKEDVYRRMKAEHEARRRDEFFRNNPPGSRITECLERISTTSDGDKMMAAIGTMQQMRDAMAMEPGRFS